MISTIQKNDIELGKFLTITKYSSNIKYTKEQYVRFFILLNKISNLSSNVYNIIFIRKLIYFYLRPNNYLYKRGLNIQLNNGLIGTIVRINKYNRNFLRETKSFDVYLTSSKEIFIYYEGNKQKIGLIDDINKTISRKNRLVRKIDPLDCTLIW